MMFINYIYIYICNVLTKITLLTTQSITNIIKLIQSYILIIKPASTDDTIKNKVKKKIFIKNNIYYNKNKILNKCVCEYNMCQECDWGWFVAIDDCDVHI
jgi:hypothetical protein